MRRVYFISKYNGRKAPLKITLKEHFVCVCFMDMKKMSIYGGLNQKQYVSLYFFNI